jgi:hypothetical protein
MQVTTMEILGWDGENSPTLPFTRATRDALAKYCELRWPNGRRKAVCKEWDLTSDEARSICEATASVTTIEKVWKHPRGQWEVAIPVLGAVIGVHLDAHLEAKRRQSDERTRRLGTLVRDISPFCRAPSLDADHVGIRRRVEPRAYGRRMGQD